MRGNESKITVERYTEIASKLHNSEDLIDFVYWYAKRLGLTTIINECNEEVETELYHALEDMENAWETEIEKPTRNIFKYRQAQTEEEQAQYRNYMRSVL